MYTILDALGSRPDVWAKTVFIISYDENDGSFDHVPPPTAPEGTPGEWVSSEVFDHTSTLKFLEQRFGVREPNISAWRRRTVGDMTSALRLSHRDPSFPRLPDPHSLFELEQREAATLPLPTVPTLQRAPHQEHGRSPRTP